MRNTDSKLNFSILNNIQSVTAKAHQKIKKQKCNLLMPSYMQCKCVEGCRSVLTVITDTPAVVLLSLGPVLKCFLIFPATGSWCSFSDTPSSWKIQRTKLHKLNLLYYTALFLSSTRMYTGDSGQRTDIKILNLHWPSGDRAPALQCISDPPLPAASQWSEPK